MISYASRAILDPFLVAQRHSETMGSSEGSNVAAAGVAAHASHPLTSRPFRADLHCHSICSDGTDTPQGLVDLAIKEGLQGLSITDHDTVDAYAQIQSPALRLLPGCEFSTVWQEGAVHVLAYGFNPRDPRVLELCVDQQRRRVDRNRAILERLRNYRMEIREEEMALQTSAWGRPHIAQALVQKGYVGSVREAFQRYLGEGKLCYVPGSRPSTAEMIEWLKQLSAIVVLAHPHLLPSRPWVHELLALPWDGIEAHYAGQSEVACKRFVKMAEKRGWLVTGGSDYHGSVKPQSRLGTSWTDEKVFDHLYNHYQAVSRQ